MQQPSNQNSVLGEHPQQPPLAEVKRDERGQRRGRGPGRGRDGGSAGDKEFAEVTVELSRVTRVTKGGKRMRFRAAVLVGDRKGQVGGGVAKGADVTLAVNKATRQAKKHLFRIPLYKNTIPHRVDGKFGAAVVLLKPAPEGSGIIAGGSTRLVLELAGVPNVVSKSLGSKNKINNIRATFEALRKLKSRNQK